MNSNDSDIHGAASAEPTPVATFASFNLAAPILKALTDKGYTIPTPIQAQAIPKVMQGLDVMGAAQTGTGKTAAFSLPILHNLMPHASLSPSPARHPVRALVLAPTRELADQIYDNVRQYAEHTGLRAAVVFGGMDMRPQEEAIRAGVEVLIATPGRLLDHVRSKVLNLGTVSILVLDEADRMLDMGFLPDLNQIVSLLPKQRQTLLFSATFSEDIRRLSKHYLSNPVTVEVARRNASAETVTQQFVECDSRQKEAALIEILQREPQKQAITFVNAKLGASRLARHLQRVGIAAEAIHGDRSQSERLITLSKFKQDEVKVLVATDVAARGLDIPDLPIVVNVDVPYNAEDYVHRIGRTGRAGASGSAYTLVTPDDDRLVADIEKLINKKPERVRFSAKPAYSQSGASGSRSSQGAYSSQNPRPARDGAPLDLEAQNIRRAKQSKGGRSFNDSPAYGNSNDAFFFKPYEESVATENAVANSAATAAPTPSPSPAPVKSALGKKPAAPRAALFGALGAKR